MNKIVSTKRTSAIFLAIVLVTGTFALSSQSFNIGVNAQAQPYYGMDSYDDRKSYGMDSYDDRKSYGMDDSYGPTDYRDDKDKKYDSYGYSDYGMDRSYDDRKSYDKKPYGNDNGYYESQYSSSYEPDYKPKHSSYDKDDRDKSKKDSSKKSVNINKIKCINTNLNINGNNAGNVSIGNKGQGYLAVSTSVGGGYGGDDGYSKQGKGFDCVINNNNTNTNIVSNVTGGGGGGNVPEITCEECFEENLPAQTFTQLNATLTGPGLTITIGGQTTLINSLGELCDELEGNSALDVFIVLNEQLGLLRDDSVNIVVCLGQILDFLT